MKPKQLLAKQKFIKALEAEGYELLSTYTLARETVKVRCSNNHEYEITPAKFNHGRRCKHCAKSNRPNTKSLITKQKFMDALEADGYELLSDYNGYSNHVLVKCPHNHEYKVKPANYLSGKRCPRCAEQSRPDNKRIKAEIKFKSILEAEGYKLLSPYTLARDKVKVRCKCSHIYEVTPINYNYGRRCPRCADYSYDQNKQGLFYLVRWTHPTTKHSFLKFGITNHTKYKIRIDQQKTYTKYKPTVIEVKYFLDGSIPPSIEQTIHKELQTSYMKKEDFRTYTETVEDTKSNEQHILKMLK